MIDGLSDLDLPQTRSESPNDQPSKDEYSHLRQENSGSRSSDDISFGNKIYRISLSNSKVKRHSSEPTVHSPVTNIVKFEENVKFGDIPAEDSGSPLQNTVFSFKKRRPETKSGAIFRNKKRKIKTNVKAKSFGGRINPSIRDGDLTFLKKIGKGSFGIVWKAEYLGSYVAVKKIKKDLLSRKQIKMLSKEGETWQRIPPHENVVRFVDFGQCSDRNGIKLDSIFLVLEFMKDGSVLDLLQERKVFTLKEKYNMLKQISAGVWNLHNANCVHRDLALRNILIDLGNFRVAVTDFGLSRHLDTQEKSNRTATTLAIAWSAPESLKDQTYT
eukprot:UN32910